MNHERPDGATLQTWYPAWLIGRIRETAQRRHMSHAEVIREAVSRYLDTVNALETMEREHHDRTDHRTAA